MKNWPTQQAIRQLVSQINVAATEYKKNLVGNTFLYYFEGRYIEVLYRSKDFAHLTGVGTSLSAADLYKEAIRGTLQDTQISFSQRHPYKLSVRKLSHLLQLSKITTSPIFLLEDLSTATASFKFGITELNCTLCLDHDLDSEGIPKSDMLIAKSLRDEDSFNRAVGAYEVNMIFKKPNSAKLYACCTFNDDKVNINDLPEEVLQKVDLSSLTYE